MGEKEKICFFCGKKGLDWKKRVIEWVVWNMHLCEDCKKEIEIRFGVSKPIREPGEEG